MCAHSTRRRGHLIGPGVHVLFSHFLQLKELVEIILAPCTFSAARAQYEISDVLRLWSLCWGGATGELRGLPHDCSAHAAGAGAGGRTRAVRSDAQSGGAVRDCSGAGGRRGHLASIIRRCRVRSFLSRLSNLSLSRSLNLRLPVPAHGLASGCRAICAGAARPGCVGPGDGCGAWHGPRGMDRSVAAGSPPTPLIDTDDRSPLCTSPAACVPFTSPCGPRAPDASLCLFRTRLKLRTARGGQRTRTG